MAANGGTCQFGVPLASHRRCVACGVVLGCPDEQPSGKSPFLCASCEEAGARVGIQGKKKKRLLRVSEVAEAAGVSSATIRRMIGAGELEASPMRRRSTSSTGTRYLISEAAIAKAFPGLKSTR